MITNVINFTQQINGLQNPSLSPEQEDKLEKDLLQTILDSGILNKDDETKMQEPDSDSNSDEENEDDAKYMARLAKKPEKLRK